MGRDPEAVREVPGYYVVELEAGGAILIRDNAEYYPAVLNEMGSGIQELAEAFAAAFERQAQEVQEAMEALLTEAGGD